MVPLVSLAYLDRILRFIFPNKAHLFFGGTVVVISGDAYQLPVVNVHGILCEEGSLQKFSSSTFEILNHIHTHFTKNILFLELQESIRQESDRTFSDILMRMRVCVCNENDVRELNSRFFPNLDNLGSQKGNWKTAPILAGMNSSVAEINLKSTYLHGRKLGVFIVHNLPITTKLFSEQKIENRLKAFWNTKEKRTSSSNSYGKRFKPPPELVLYPGMPVMLRVNICPSLGLSNGSIGTIRAVLNSNVPSIESSEDVPKRVLSSNDDCTFVPFVLVDFKNYYKGKLSAFKCQSDGANNRTKNVVLIEPQTFSGVKGLPLSPAHSMTMHKSQSLTIPFCIIDPSNVFAPGQLYVAFSRAPGIQKIALNTRVSLKLLNKYKSITDKKTAKLADMKENSVSFKPFRDYIRAHNEGLDEIPNF